MLVFNKYGFNYKLFLFISKIQKKNTAEAKQMYLNILYLMMYCLELNFDAYMSIFNSESLLIFLDGEEKQRLCGRPLIAFHGLGRMFL